jgi:hypothetical protein
MEILARHVIIFSVFIVLIAAEKQEPFKVYLSKELIHRIGLTTLYSF